MKEDLSLYMKKLYDIFASAEFPRHFCNLIGKVMKSKAIFEEV